MDTLSETFLDPGSISNNVVWDKAAESFDCARVSAAKQSVRATHGVKPISE
jgi:hypothetical protein